MTSHAIRMTDVRFRWNAETPPILDIAALSVSTGEKILIRGASGSGKTTLLNLLGGVTIPESGHIEALGSDLTAMSTADRDSFRADNVGFIFQMFNLIPYLSLVENVLLPCRFSQNRRNAARQKHSQGVEQEAVRLLSHMQLDVTALRNRPVTELSTGQQQRVAAARALIGSPPIIIADEPTSALDADARHTFLDLLFGEIKEADGTLIFVSHDAGLSGHFDRTIELADISNGGTP